MNGISGGIAAKVSKKADIPIIQSLPSQGLRVVSDVSGVVTLEILNDGVDLMPSLPLVVQSVLRAPHIVRSNKTWMPNSLSGVFKPRAHQHWVFTNAKLVDSRLDQALDRVSLKIYDPALIKTSKSLVCELIIAHVKSERDELCSARYDVEFILRHPRAPGAGFAELFLLYVLDAAKTRLFEEDFTSRCERIRRFYSSLWLSDSDSNSRIPHLRDIESYKVAISETEHVWSVGNEAPLEYGLVLAWPELIGALLNHKDIGGDLFSLVHLTNEFIVPPSHPVLTPETPVSAKADIVGIRQDAVAGRVVMVEAQLFREDGQALLVTIRSEFAIRSFDDSMTIVPISPVQKHNYTLTLSSAQHLSAILASKSWHNIEDAYLLDRIHADDNIVFDVETGVTIDGYPFTKGSISHLGKVIGAVSSPSNVVVLSFLKRFGTDANQVVMYETPQSLRRIDFLAPSTNQIYAIASTDLNPIHTSSVAASLAGLESPIVHGMNTAARSRHALERSIHGRIVSLKVRFERPVLSAKQLRLKPELIGRKQGRRVVDFTVVELSNGDSDSAVVLRGRAEVEDVNPVAYVFTGQGSASPMMGQDLVDRSQVASMIWSRADAYLKQRYGFSIVEIVRTNPRELRVQLTRELRANYAALTVDQRSKDGVVQSVQVFPETQDESSTEIVFKGGSEGLLFSTQFQQPAILISEKASFENFRSKGAVSSRAIMAGHSLGEYSALACALQDLAVEKLAELVFVRGITMQAAVQRDEQGRSTFGMVAASPARVGSWFSDEDLVDLVNCIAEHTSHLLQVVNFNVRRTQYVVSGELIALEILRRTLDRLRANGSATDVTDAMKTAIEEVTSSSTKRFENVRGSSTFPLRGIDVPFHSRLLLPGVHSFRKVLTHAFDSLEIDPSMLENKYVPNLVGHVFTSASPSLAKDIIARTQSQVCVDLVERWDQIPRSQRCKTLLIELLAFQFASPVLWISTQDAILQQGVERFIEVGPSPVLLPFISKSFPERLAELELLWAGSDEDQRLILHLDDAIEETVEELVPGEEAAQDEVPESPVIETIASHSPTPTATAPSQSVSQPLLIPLSVLHSIRILAAHKLGLDLAKVTDNKNLKSLSGGKSALQNEVRQCLEIPCMYMPLPVVLLSF